MADDIQYVLSVDGSGIDAIFHGQIIGQVSFVRIGMDKLIIDSAKDKGTKVRMIKNFKNY